jgi:hypothetical protein
MSTSPSPSPAVPAAPEPTAAPAPSPTSRPEYIPEKFWDAAANAPKVEDLGKSYGELQSKLGKGKEAFEAERLARRPEAADKYEIAIEGFDAETIAAFPLSSTLREVAFDLGLGPEEANGVFAKVIGALTKDLPDPVAEKAKLGADADTRLQAIDTFVEKTFTDPEERASFEYLARNAAGVRAVEKLIALAGGGQAADTRLAEGGSPTPQGETREAIMKLMDSEAYYHPQKRDPAVVARVQAFWEKNSK